MDRKEIKQIVKDFNILFIDDEEYVVETMKEILPLLFKNVYFATNGKEGIEIFQKEKIDLVISDLSMPVMSGMDMLNIMYEINPDIKSIILSGHNEPEYMEYINRHNSSFIVKPISSIELFRALSEVV